MTLWIKSDLGDPRKLEAMASAEEFLAIEGRLDTMYIFFVLPSSYTKYPNGQHFCLLQCLVIRIEFIIPGVDNFPSPFLNTNP